MNTSPNQMSLSPSRPLTERVVAEVCEALGAMQTAFSPFWRRSAVDRDERRRYDAVAELSAHVLKDIGAPHWLIANAVDRQATRDLWSVGMDLR